MEQKGGEGKQGEASWQDFKKAGKLGQGVGALKRGGGGWNPLTNYVLLRMTTLLLALEKQLKN